ncbi:collagen-like protein [Cotonvirus japonicus]|uniref:Collagen-like protein n=1 Tax=Cotonvirus japonicus TaxID=2811091 RepID=A0ABM7NQY7_9VIRU|nr:collagen-like protein [Cotonvirus japonicus]BCS82573.1 collagen-like protein [Cotonvirus japonicus]
MKNHKVPMYRHSLRNENNNNENKIQKYIDNKINQLYKEITSEKMTQFIPGQPGAKGEAGSRIFVEQFNPSYALGSNGDIFINNVTWDLYKKTHGNWVLMGTFRGADGQKGQKGEMGRHGETGKSIKGDKGEIGSTGLKGDQGEKGEKGDQGSQGEVGIQGEKGDSNIIFTFEYTTPGDFSVTVPEGAVNAIVTLTGGGGAGGVGGTTGPESSPIYVSGPGGGASGTIYQYPVSVTFGQEITGTIGKGGIANYTVIADGENSTLTVGENQFICFGGKGGTIGVTAIGGTGETVSFPIASQFFPLPAPGGTIGQVGFNGNIGNNAYSGGGGGGSGSYRPFVSNGSVNAGNGGMVLGFNGGITGITGDVGPWEYAIGGGGGGASALANGGNGGNLINLDPNPQPGTLGSGGGGGYSFTDTSQHTYERGANGGDGYVLITFYSS